jgi:hypothetical protein
MSGFEIFGVVAAVGPIIVSTVPAIIEAIETMRTSKIIKEDTAKFIVDLSRELRVWYTVLDQIRKSSPIIRDPQMAEDFRQLFEDLPAAVEKIDSESKRIIEKSTTLTLLIYRPKLEGMILKLEGHLQRLFRRISLLVFHVRELPGQPQRIIASDVLNDVDRLSRIRNLLEARLGWQSKGDIFITDKLVDKRPVVGTQLVVAMVERAGIRVSTFFATAEININGSLMCIFTF